MCKVYDNGHGPGGSGGACRSSGNTAETAGRLACVPPRPAPLPLPAWAGDAEPGPERRGGAALFTARHTRSRHRSDRRRDRGGAHPRTGRPGPFPVVLTHPFRTPGNAPRHPLQPAKLRRVVHPHDGVPQDAPVSRRPCAAGMVPGVDRGIGGVNGGPAVLTQNGHPAPVVRMARPPRPSVSARVARFGIDDAGLQRPGRPLPPPTCWRRSSI